MTTFGFMIHYAFNEYQRSLIESFFAGLKGSINVLNNHNKLTNDLYKKERDRSLTELKKSFEEPLKLANERYEEEIRQNGNTNEGHQIASHYSGLGEIENHLSSGEYQIEENFEGIFLHTNNTALISCYSFFEKEIKKLCEILQSEFNEEISHNDFAARDYMENYLKYLKLVIKIDVAPLDTFITKLKQLQYLRNRIVHNGGEFLKDSTDKDDKITKVTSIQNASKGRLIISDEGAYHLIKILDIGYVEDFYAEILKFFQAIFDQLEIKKNYPILKARLKHLFSLLDKDIKVDILSLKAASTAYTVSMLLKFPKSKGLGPNQKVIIKIGKNTVPLFISYKGRENKKLKSFGDNLVSTPHIFLNDLLFDYVLIQQDPNAVFTFDTVKKK